MLITGQNATAAHLPREAVALAVVESKVTHLAVLDVHPRLSHIALGSSIARLSFVGNDLRDGANVRPAVVFVFVDGVDGSIPGEHLKSKGRGVRTRGNFVIALLWAGGPMECSKHQKKRFRAPNSHKRHCRTDRGMMKEACLARERGAYATTRTAENEPRTMRNGGTAIYKTASIEMRNKRRSLCRSSRKAGSWYSCCLAAPYVVGVPPTFLSSESSGTPGCFCVGWSQPDIHNDCQGDNHVRTQPSF